MPRSLRALPSIADRTCMAGILLATTHPRTGITISSRQTANGETVGVVYPKLPSSSPRPCRKSKRQSPDKKQRSIRRRPIQYAVQRRRPKMAVNISSLHFPGPSRTRRRKAQHTTSRQPQHKTQPHEPTRCLPLPLVNPLSRRHHAARPKPPVRQPKDQLYDA